MKAHQNGFSVVELLIVLVVVGVLGAVGWFVYDRNRNRANVDSMTSTTSTTQTKTSTSQSTLPSNWATFENKEYGFKFAYPKEWQLKEFDKVSQVGIESPAQEFSFDVDGKQTVKKKGYLYINLASNKIPQSIVRDETEVDFCSTDIIDNAKINMKVATFAQSGYLYASDNLVDSIMATSTTCQNQMREQITISLGDKGVKFQIWGELIPSDANLGHGQAAFFVRSEFKNSQAYKDLLNIVQTFEAI